MTIGVYGVYNNKSKMMYVGQSVKIETRVRKHFLCLFRETHSNTHLQSSYNKHGLDAFSWHILDVCDETQLDILEKKWILQYRSDDSRFGFNKTDGGSIFKRHNKDARMLMSLKARNRSEETRLKLSISLTGRKFSDERKRMMSESRKGKPASPKQKEHLNELHFNAIGKHRSDDVRRKISEGHKGKTLSPEHCLKISMRRKGSKASEETKKKMSIAQTERWKKR